MIFFEWIVRTGRCLSKEASSGAALSGFKAQTEFETHAGGVVELLR